MFKRKLLLLPIVAFLFSVGCEKKLDTDVKKVSYAIGQQIGQNMKTQKIELDPNVFAMSIDDAINGKPSKLKPEEIQQAIMKLQENMMGKQKEESLKNETEGKAFLEKNKTEAGVKVTPSGLQYTIITEGTGKSPKETDVVKVHYKGYLVNNQVFDSSYERNQPAEFPLNGVVKGWTEGLQLLKVGGKMKLFVPPELGYGPSARPQIPPGSVLIFEIELLDIVAPPTATGMKAPPAGKTLPPTGKPEKK